MLYLFQKLFNSLNYVIINGACNLNINIWNITQRFVLTSKIWCTRSVFFKIRSERLRDTFTFSLMYCTNWNVKPLNKNCDTKRNILQYAFLYMMFLFSSFVIVDNFELAKVVNEECIFCINTDYERIYFNERASR